MSVRTVVVPFYSGSWSTKVRNKITVPGKKVRISMVQVPQHWKEGHPPLTCTMNVVRDIEREVVVDHVLDLIDIITSQCLWPVLWNRNYFLRFRFRLLKSYGSGSGSGSDFCQVTVPVPYVDLKSSFPKVCLKKSCLSTV